MIKSINEQLHLIVFNKEIDKAFPISYVNMKALYTEGYRVPSERTGIVLFEPPYRDFNIYRKVEDERLKYKYEIHILPNVIEINKLQPVSTPEEVIGNVQINTLRYERELIQSFRYNSNEEFEEVYNSLSRYLL